MAGTVVAVGPGVTRFAPGDEVFGIGGGSFAEYAVAKEAKLARKPASIGFEQAAVMPVSGMTALQGLRDSGNLQPGQHVLILGASGGVGSYAVQVAKAMGAEVTGVASTAKLDLVRELGADHVIDYTRQDPTDGSVRYDLILDTGGRTPLRTASPGPDRARDAGHRRRRGWRPAGRRLRPADPRDDLVPVRPPAADRRGVQRAGHGPRAPRRAGRGRLGPRRASTAPIRWPASRKRSAGSRRARCVARWRSRSEAADIMAAGRGSPQQRRPVRSRTMGFDLLVRGGLLIDGSGTPGRPADIGVAGDRVAAVGDLSAVADREVETVIDAAGLVVAPGFIDPHGHSDASALIDGALASHLRQGYTTQLSGNCGYTLAPLTPGRAGADAAGPRCRRARGAVDHVRAVPRGGRRAAAAASTSPSSSATAPSGAPSSARTTDRRTTPSWRQWSRTLRRRSTRAPWASRPG